MRGLHETVGEAEERMKDIDLTTEQIARSESRLSAAGKELLRELAIAKNNKRIADEVHQGLTVMMDKLIRDLDLEKHKVS